MTVQLFQDNCRIVARSLPADSIDSAVTDPPYEIGFMGKSWDNSGVAFDPTVWADFYRVLKPGAHMVAFGGTRSHHRLMCAIEDAGFEIRDCLMWVYGQGFPKSRDVSKAIDTEAGAAREVIGINEDYLRRKPNGMKTAGSTAYGYSETQQETNANITAPATDAARQWAGWGTALKPAWEPIVLVRKPLSEKTVAANVLRWGTGAINIKGCRIELRGKTDPRLGGKGEWHIKRVPDGSTVSFPPATMASSEQGRWPANLVHDGSAEVLEGFPITGPGQIGGNNDPNGAMGYHGGAAGKSAPGVKDAGGSAARFFYSTEERGTRPGGFANIGADKGSSVPNGPTYDDGDGSTSRFFYCAKASKKDRNAGCDAEHPNKHPTVKPTPLMQWLCRLVTQPGGTVFDPFLGSGSTGRGAVLEGFNFIGCDLDDIAIARMRIDAAIQDWAA